MSDIIRGSFGNNKYGLMKRTLDDKEPAWEMMGVVGDVKDIHLQFQSGFGYVKGELENGTPVWNEIPVADYVASIKKHFKPMYSIDPSALGGIPFDRFLETSYPEVLGEYYSTLEGYPYEENIVEFCEKVGWKAGTTIRVSETGAGPFGFDGYKLTDMKTDKGEYVTFLPDLDKSKYGFDNPYTVVGVEKYEVKKEMFDGEVQLWVTFMDGSKLSMHRNTVNGYAWEIEMPREKYSSAEGVYEFLMNGSYRSRHETIMSFLRAIS